MIRIIGTDAARRHEASRIVEALIATTVLMVVCGTVMRGVLGLTDVSRSCRTAPTCTTACATRPSC